MKVLSASAGICQRSIPSAVALLAIVGLIASQCVIAHAQPPLLGDPKINDLTFIKSAIAVYPADAFDCGNHGTPSCTTCECNLMAGAQADPMGIVKPGCGSSCGNVEGGAIARRPFYPGFTSEGSRSNGPGPTDGIYTKGNSVINNLSFNYMHYADDLKQSVPGGVMLRRFHRTRNMTEVGSFGPGVFTQYDLRLKISPTSYVDSAYLFDPTIMSSRTLYRGVYGGNSQGSPPVGPRFAPDRKGDLKEMILLNGSFQPVVTDSTKFHGAVYAELRTWGGEKFIFELLKIASSGYGSSGGSSGGGGTTLITGPFYNEAFPLDGRLVRIVDSAGQIISITYKSFAQTLYAQSPSRMWQMDAVTDPYGRQITFTYGTSTIAGNWAISSITAPGGAVTNYVYNGSFLTQVTNPDASVSTFAYGFDTASNCGTLTINDANAALAGEDRRKTVFLSGMVANTTTGQIVGSSAQAVRMVLNGENEVSYVSFPVDNHINFIYEGGGKLKRIFVDHYTNHNERSINYLQNWQISQPGAPEGWIPITGTLEPTNVKDVEATIWDLWAGKPSVVFDSSGVQANLYYDADNWMIYKRFSDNSIEAYTYNSEKQIIRQRSRTGDIVKNQYNAAGLLSTRETGIREAATNTPAIATNGTITYNLNPTNDVQTSSYAIETWQYDAGGRITASINPAGRTDYLYNTAGQLLSEKKPADVPGCYGPNCGRSFGRIVTVEV